MEFLNTMVFDLGLANLWDMILKNWLTYIYVGAVAFFAVVFLKDRAWMKLIGFFGIAAVVGILIFGGKALFAGDGSGGTLTNIGKDAVGKINTIDTVTGVASNAQSDFSDRF